MEGDRRASKILTGKLTGRLRGEWEDNITSRMDLEETGVNTKN